MRIGLPLVLAAVCGAMAAATAQASPRSASAFDNSTVQPGGPRSGGNGQKFFNVEGSGNTTFASFGVADFKGSSFNYGAPVSAINSAELVLTESNAAFTAPGSLNIYLTQDITTGIDNGSSSLMFQASSGPDGIGTQLSPHSLIGTGMFSSSGNTNTGQVDTYALTLSSADKSYLVSQLNSGNDIRLIIAPADASVAATFAGFTNTAQAGPVLTIDAAAVPEPALLGVLVFSATLALRRRCAS